MPKIATLDDYKVTTAHGKLLYNIGKKNNLTIQDLAKELSCSVVYIRSILKGDLILSICLLIILGAYSKLLISIRKSYLFKFEFFS